MCFLSAHSSVFAFTQVHSEVWDSWGVGMCARVHGYKVYLIYFKAVNLFYWMYLQPYYILFSATLQEHSKKKKSILITYCNLVHVLYSITPQAS